MKAINKIIKNLWYGNRNLLLRLTKQNLKPRWMWFAVTDKCNSHCTHCHIWQQKPEENPLTLEELDRFFSDPLLKDIELIINSGGEAIIHPQILELLQLEHQKFPKAVINISTNAIMADKVLTVTKALLEEKTKLNLGISIDGIGEKHDKIRGVPGNFQKVDYLTKELIKLQQQYPGLMTITMGFTLSELTIDNWLEVKEYCEKLGVEVMAQWYNQSSFYSNEADENKIIQDRMTEIVKSLPLSTTKERWLRLLADKSIKFNCFALDTFFAMKCTGEIIPCLTHWDATIGSAKENTFKEIWTSQKAKNIRKMVAKCPGCLNSWGLNWSLSSAFYPRLAFFLRNPKEIINWLKTNR